MVQTSFLANIENNPQIDLLESGSIWIPGIILLCILSFGFLALMGLSRSAQVLIHTQIAMDQCQASLARSLKRDFNQIETLNQILEITRLEVQAVPPQAKPPLLAQTYVTALAQDAVLLPWRVGRLLQIDQRCPGIISLVTPVLYQRIPYSDSNGARTLEWRNLSFGKTPELISQRIARPFRFGLTGRSVKSGFRAWLTTSKWGVNRQWHIEWYLAESKVKPTGKLALR